MDYQLMLDGFQANMLGNARLIMFRLFSTPANVLIKFIKHLFLFNIINMITGFKNSFVIFAIGIVFRLTELYLVLGSDYVFATSSYKYMFIPNIPSNDIHPKQYWDQYKINYLNSILYTKIGLLLIQMFFSFMADTCLGVKLDEMSNRMNKMQTQIDQMQIQINEMRTDIDNLPELITRNIEKMLKGLNYAELKEISDKHLDVEAPKETPRPK
jgi:hypothetical protein